MTALDCWVHTPFVLVPTFYVTTGLLRGKSLQQDILPRLKDEFWVAGFGQMFYWTPVQM